MAPGDVIPGRVRNSLCPCVEQTHRTPRQVNGSGARGRIASQYSRFGRDHKSPSLAMNPEAVSDALHEYERAVQDHAECFSSHLENCDKRNKTRAITLVSPSSSASLHVTHGHFLQKKKLVALDRSVEDARSSVLSANGGSLMFHLCHSKYSAPRRKEREPRTSSELVFRFPPVGFRRGWHTGRT